MFEHIKRSSVLGSLPSKFNKQFQIIKMASGIMEKYKIRPNLGPFSVSMAKAVASVAVLALQNIQTGKNHVYFMCFKRFQRLQLTPKIDLVSYSNVNNFKFSVFFALNTDYIISPLFISVHIPYY